MYNVISSMLSKIVKIMGSLCFCSTCPCLTHDQLSSWNLVSKQHTRLAMLVIMNVLRSDMSCTLHFAQWHMQ